MERGIFLGVLGAQIDHIEIFDERFQGPYISVENESQKVVFQNIDSFQVDGEMIDVFRINHVSLNMNVSERYCTEAEVAYKNFVEYKLLTEESSTYDRAFLIEKSKKFCDYIEAIERAIVFAYTSVESFINLSIPQDYSYEETEKSGKIKTYDAYDIQRKINLKTKIKKIICRKYGLKNLTQQKFWSKFCELESIRNDIIHLKNTSYNDSIQRYLEPKIFKNVRAANELIEYIIIEQRKNGINGTEYLWPRIDNENRSSVIYETSSSLRLPSSNHHKDR